MQSIVCGEARMCLIQYSNNKIIRNRTNKTQKAYLYNKRVCLYGHTLLLCIRIVFPKIGDIL